MTARKHWRVGVVCEAFLDYRLDEVMGWLTAAAPSVSCLELGAGGYAPHPHCDVSTLLATTEARRDWYDAIVRRGFGISALNAWGNPLHPDAELRQRHDTELRDAIRLAAALGVDRVVAMAGCPAASPNDTTPHFAAGGWLPYLEGVWDRQWEDAIAPYWSDLAEFARRESPDLHVCIELHPGTVVYNVDTFERLASLGPSLAVNFDPSHFFWMQMDGLAVAARLAPWVGHVHAKDTVFYPDRLALNGLLDRRWPFPPTQMPWTFAVPGRGHDQNWWAALLAILEPSPARVVSIEHEDPFVPVDEGVPEAAALLDAAISDVQRAVLA